MLVLLYINGLSDDVICNIAIFADDTTLYSKCDQASDLCKQLEYMDSTSQFRSIKYPLVAVFGKISSNFSFSSVW